jgi:hypothetical protein
MRSARVYRAAVDVSYLLPPISQLRAASNMLLSIGYRSAVSIPEPWLPISQGQRTVKRTGSKGSGDKLDWNSIAKEDVEFIQSINKYLPSDKTFNISILMAVSISVALSANIFFFASCSLYINVHYFVNIVPSSVFSFKLVVDKWEK